jgi:hypothetical protein
MGKSPFNKWLYAIIGFVIGIIIGAIPTLFYYQIVNTQFREMQDIINLQKSETIAYNQPVNQPAGYTTSWTFRANYAGYVKIIVSSSTTTNTFVEIKGISFNGISYDSGRINVGYGGTVYFPVLPGDVYVYVGNTNLINGASETVTIIYIY